MSDDAAGTVPVRDRWADACLAMRLIALDPGLGIAIKGPPGPARDHWLEGLRRHLPPTTPWRSLPAGTPNARLVGGVDLAATLATGHLVAARGLLAEADGGILVVASAERLDGAISAQCCATLDTGLARVERDGIGGAAAARLGIVALDDARADHEGAPPPLLDRLALRLDLSDVSHRGCGPIPPEPDEIATARRRLASVVAEPAVAEALCAAAEALGIPGLRAPIAALRAARACAALSKHGSIEAEDVSAAARLVLGPRATRAPAASAPETEAPSAQDSLPDDPPADGPADRPDDDEARAPDDGSDAPRLEELAVAAAIASLPADLLSALALGAARGGLSGARRGGAATPGRRGRPVGSRRGEPGRGSSLDVLATLRAAAPWQRLRGGGAAGDRVLIRRDDFRVRRLVDRQRTTTIFAVDASGSAALNRLAEAKGAVELLLAECYIRRDDVALIAFRGLAADVLLPPTRSPARAKRELASLPGGGPTPLASGLAMALDLANVATRSGRRPVLAVLTDGRGNVARDGTTDRARAAADGAAAARAILAAGVAAIVIDVSPRPGPAAARLAAEMGATYLPLPLADARGIAGAVGAIAASATGL